MTGFPENGGHQGTDLPFRYKIMWLLLRSAPTGSALQRPKSGNLWFARRAFGRCRARFAAPPTPGLALSPRAGRIHSFIDSTSEPGLRRRSTWRPRNRGPPRGRIGSRRSVRETFQQGFPAASCHTVEGIGGLRGSFSGPPRPCRATAEGALRFFRGPAPGLGPRTAAQIAAISSPVGGWGSARDAVIEEHLVNKTCKRVTRAGKFDELLSALFRHRTSPRSDVLWFLAIKRIAV